MALVFSPLVFEVQACPQSTPACEDGCKCKKCAHAQGCDKCPKGKPCDKCAKCPKEKSCDKCTKAKCDCPKAKDGKPCDCPRCKK